MDKRREAMLEIYKNGPWIYDPLGGFVYAGTPNDMISQIANIRGHGFLTGEGYGAMGLPEVEADFHQDVIGRRIASVPDMRALLAEVLKCELLPVRLRASIHEVLRR